MREKYALPNEICLMGEMCYSCGYTGLEKGLI